MEARLVNPDTEQDIVFNKEGELWLPHNNPTATANSIDKEGWFHTGIFLMCFVSVMYRWGRDFYICTICFCAGDIAFEDENNLFYIVDRLTELIKYKGFQIPPAELEAYLLEHPAVADAAVIGRP
ncbi:hypothetical protein BJ741DRAFT_621405 [Chytriomyces cf. hyalinus JEL632]|nr:hypothetical protein BJ741DRAFT_621405 [Chytriomyces cf. hyalinus JEL632]